MGPALPCQNTLSVLLNLAGTHPAGLHCLGLQGAKLGSVSQNLLTLSLLFPAPTFKYWFSVPILGGGGECVPFRDNIPLT